MKKTYQPQILEMADHIMDNLEKIDFFKENEIENKEPAFEILCNNLTKKFIAGELEIDLISDEEFSKILDLMILASLINELKEKGFVDSLLDENNEEGFFLTKKGQKYYEENL